MKNKILFLICFFMAGALNAMEREHTGDFTMERDMCDYTERNYRAASACLGCGITIGVFSFAFKEPMLLFAGAMCCLYAGHHCAVACNESAEPSTNEYRNSINKGMRYIFCLKHPGES